jgi:outer membrane protein TolC
MKTFQNILFTAVIFLKALSLQAQEPLVLSLDSALNYAIENNKTLVNSKYAVDKSTQRIKENIALGLPQINAYMDYTNFLGAQATLQLNPEAPPAVIDFNPTSNFTASVNQLVFSGNFYVGIQLLKLSKVVSEQNYQKEELNVKEQTIQAYCIILASERISGIISENKKNAELIYEKTTNLANAGMIEETDAKKLSIMVASVDNSLKSSERQVEMGYNLLRLQLGLNSEQEVKLTTTLEDIAKQYIFPSISKDTFNIMNNMDYQIVATQGKIAEKNIDLKKSNYLPSLTAFYSHTEKLQKPLFDMTPKNMLGLTLSVPILSSGQRLAQVNQAKIDYNTLANTKELLTQQLTLQERQIRYNYNTLMEQYVTQKENVAIAKEVLDKMDLKYQQGIVSSLELTSANNDYLTAETTFTNIILQLLNAEMTLREINGKL